jgi:hypothetical protein
VSTRLRAALNVASARTADRERSHRAEFCVGRAPAQPDGIGRRPLLAGERLGRGRRKLGHRRLDEPFQLRLLIGHAGLLMLQRLDLIDQRLDGFLLLAERALQGFEFTFLGHERTRAQANPTTD